MSTSSRFNEEYTPTPMMSSEGEQLQLMEEGFEVKMEAMYNALTAGLEILSAEIGVRTPEDGNLTTDLLTEANTRANNDSALSSLIQSEAITRTNDAVTLASLIQDEAKVRAEDVLTLSAAIDNVRNAIGLINPENLSTATDLQNQVTSLANTLRALSDLVTLEIKSLKTTDETFTLHGTTNTLQGQVTNLTSDVNAALVILQGTINTEITDRKYTDETFALKETTFGLQNQVNTLTTDITAALSTLQVAINAEIKTRGDVDATFALQTTTQDLQVQVNGLSATIGVLATGVEGDVASLGTLQLGLVNEIKNRSDSDIVLNNYIDALQSSLTSEIGDRKTADGTFALKTYTDNSLNGLQTAINTEITTRTIADANFNAMIVSVVNSGNANFATKSELSVETNARISTMNNEIAARKTADNTFTLKTTTDTLQNQVTDQGIAINLAQVSISDETNNRLVADNLLDSFIISVRNNTIANFATKDALSTETNTRVTTVNNEIADRKTAVTTLTNTVMNDYTLKTTTTALQSDIYNVDGKLRSQVNLDAETATRVVEDGKLYQEILDWQGANESMYSTIGNLNLEANTRLTQDTALQTQITAVSDNAIGSGNIVLVKTAAFLLSYCGGLKNGNFVELPTNKIYIITNPIVLTHGITMLGNTTIRGMSVHATYIRFSDTVETCLKTNNSEVTIEDIRMEGGNVLFAAYNINNSVPTTIVPIYGRNSQFILKNVEFDSFRSLGTITGYIVEIRGCLFNGGSLTAALEFNTGYSGVVAGTTYAFTPIAPCVGTGLTVKILTVTPQLTWKIMTDGACSGYY